MSDIIPSYESSNEFIDLIYRLYDHVRFPEKYEIVESVERNKKFPFNKKIVKIDPILEDLKFKVDAIKTTLSTTVPSFDTLWKFCWFIRIMEKVFFFHNAAENTWYIECNMEDNRADRKFRYCDDKKEIRFTLSHNIFDNDIITIQVIRKFGKEMQTKYTIVGSDIKYNDDSDLYLINEINRILMDYMSNTFGSIAQLIITENFDEVSKL